MNAGRMLKEGGAHREAGGRRDGRPLVARLVAAGIPVLGHGAAAAIAPGGGYRAQGKTAEPARRLLEEAQALQEAGAFGVVLELVPAPLAEAVTQRLAIPTIGIGSGAGCDGQVRSRTTCWASPTMCPDTRACRICAPSSARRSAPTPPRWCATAASPASAVAADGPGRAAKGAGIMKIARTIAGARAFLAPRRREGHRIGLVPTMGYFHEGHLELMRHARAENDVAAVALRQPHAVWPQRRFQRYPRDFERDCQMAEHRRRPALLAAGGEMYPEPSLTWVTVTGSPIGWRGHAPGHFRGVATVVSKLLHIIERSACFGQKISLAPGDPAHGARPELPGRDRGGAHVRERTAWR